VTTSRVFDRVIMAIPFFVLRRSSRQMRRTVPRASTASSRRRSHSSATARRQAAPPVRHAVLEHLGPWGIGNGATYSDTGYQNTWEVSRAQDGSTGILVDYTGGGVPLASFSGDPTNQALVKQYAKTFLSQLRAGVPGDHKPVERPRDARRAAQ